MANAESTVLLHKACDKKIANTIKKLLKMKKKNALVNNLHSDHYFSTFTFAMSKKKYIYIFIHIFCCNDVTILILVHFSVTL